MMEQLPLKNAVNMAHTILQPFVPSARVIVDMTCGNGHDTVFLAAHMNDAACLYAFDLQPCAIENTKAAVAAAGLAEKNIVYRQGSHDVLAEAIALPLDLVVFNLGYLPCGDHNLHTIAETTIKACKICLNKIAINGIIIIASYPGTAAGADECQALRVYLQELPQKSFHVSQWKPLNQVHEPPILYIVQKRG
jgi:ribosomal protein L11 methylase PrmA